MPSRMFLYCLGVPRLESDAGDEVRLGARKHLALLIYLALQPKAQHRRERLVDLFWSTVPQRAGRQSLATALNVLRSRLGRESIDADREHIRLAQGSVHLDVDRLLAGELLGDELTPALDIDGFLIGFDPADTPEFGMWCDRQRARLLPAIKAGLVTLMDCARRTAAADQLGLLAERLLTIDDLAEEGIRARMETSALAGDRLSAIRIYDEWSSRLARELGAAPSALVEGMATRLRRNVWERPKAQVHTLETERWRHQHFVGRAEEFCTLYEHWEVVRSSRSRHVLLTGESGVGKTTLADRFATGASLEGATVARVRCFELERGIPYAAVGGVLAGVLDKPGAAGTSPVSLAELGRVIPAVHARWPTLPPPVDAQGESARIRFAESALELLTVLMEEHPVVLVIDDFHLADEASLSVMHLLMRRLQEHPFMVVMTSRSDLPESAMNAAKIRDGASYLGVTTVEVAPMTVEEGEELLDILLSGAERSPSLPERRALLDAAGGIPMALAVLTADWEQRGAASLALSLGGMTPDVTGIPDRSFRRLTESLYQGLGTEARMVLHMAAILDSRLNEFELYGLINLSVGQTLAGMTELVARGAMRDPGGRLEFTSPMIRANAYVRVPVALRRGIHGLVADAILVREGEGEAIPGLEIAWHCIRSGRTKEAGPYLLRGGREAINGGAPHEAELALRSGLEVVSSRERELAVLIMAEALQELGAWGQSLRDLADQEWTSGQAEIESKTLVLEAQYRLELIETDDLLGKLAQIRATAKQHRWNTIHTRAILLGAAVSEGISSSELRDVLLEESQEISEESLGVTDLLRFHLSRAMLLFQQRRTSESVLVLEKARTIVLAQEVKSTLAVRLYSGLGALACSTGDYRSAGNHYTEAHRIAVCLDNELHTARAAANISLCFGRLGEYAKQGEWANTSLARTQSGDRDDYVLQALSYLAFSHAMMGQSEGALCALGESHRRFHSHTTPWLVQRHLLISADTLKILGNTKRAQSFGKNGTQGPYERPLSIGIAGTHARWTSILTLGTSNGGAILTRLAGLVSDMDHLDLVDQAELLASLILVSGPSTSLVDRLYRVLDRLPAAVGKQLDRLGVGL